MQLAASDPGLFLSSFAQRRLWLLAAQQAGVNEAYHLPVCLRLQGILDEHALIGALNEIVSRHQSLRTSFCFMDGEVYQRVSGGDINCAMHREDWSGQRNWEQSLQQRIQREYTTPFDLQRGPLIRCSLIRVSEEEHILIMTMHHIVADGWSIGILVRELSAFYRARRVGKPADLNPLPIQYTDYASWQRGWLSDEVSLRQSEYWQRTLAGAPSLLELPMDRPRPARQDFSGATVPIVLEEDLTRQLKELSQRHGATPFMTVLAAWALVLSRLSNQKDVVIGTPSANRDRLELEGLIGFFVNTLALRVDVSGELTVKQLLQQVRTVVMEAQAHAELPFEQVVELLKPVRSLNHTPIFQVMLAWRGFRETVFDLPGLEVRGIGDPAPSPARFDLTLTLGQRGSRIVGALTYATSLFDESSARRFVGYLHQAIRQMVADADQPVAAVDLLSAEERQKVLVEWNATEAEYPRGKCVHELFEQQVERAPQAIALEYEGQSLRYSELNARANQLAHYLRERGVGPGVRVGICVERSLEMVVGLLGILKAGGAYVPLDPAYPPERLAYMLTDSEPRLVLSHASTRERLEAARGQSTIEVLQLDRDATRWADESVDNLASEPVGLSSQHPAYAIYTSGSTGRPKCALNAHKGVVNRLMWLQRKSPLDPTDAVLQKTPFSFDVSVWEFFWPLLSGARLVMARPEGHKNPAYLSEVIAASGITVMHFVPSMLRAYLDAGETVRLAGLRHVICSGEKLTSDLVEECYRRGAGKLTNLYGPTEAAIEVTCYECPREISGDVPIGRPISNTQCYVLDEGYEPVPIGVAGELFLAGVQVGLGYLKRGSLTAERFVADPYSRIPGSRMYRTGDIARYRADGTIDYLGRNDAQVKVRGYRIELGEIEARLSEYPGVREAVVLAREDEPGEKRLVAYYTGAQPGSELTAEHLRTYLSVNLPEYMVPAAYVHLEAMPLSQNGKLDRKALPAPERNAFSRCGYEEPLGEIEKALSQIWCDVLKIERVGRHDNFFELGGHSLLAIRALERMRLAGLQVDVRVLFSAPVLAELAASVKVGDVIAPPIEVVDRGAPLVPSFAQHRLWLLSQLDEVRDAYHVPFGLRLHGVVDENALRAALDGLVARHESLRTTFYTQNEEVYQRVSEERSGFALGCEDWRTQPDVEQRLRERIREEFTARFDLERGPLIRGRLIRLSEEEHVLLVTMHHIVSDGWSISIFIRELSALYAAHVQGQNNPLPPLPIHYADYAAWQRHWLSEEVLSRQGEYWKRALAGAPSLLELPTDRPRPARQDFSGARLPVVLAEELTRHLKDLSHRNGVTLFTTVLAAWALVLSRLSNQKDVVIGTPSANRDRVEIEGLIGFFVNTLALRVDLSGQLTVKQLLQQARAVMLEAQAHAQLPFERVVELLKPVRGLNHTPIFQVMLAWQNFEEMGFHLPRLQVKGMQGAGLAPAKFDLTLSLGEHDHKIVGSLNYATSLFDESSARRFVGYLHQALTQMVADAEQPIATVNLLSVEERQKVLVEWNATEAEYPLEKCVHELFEEQVARTPQAIALEYEGLSLRYAELNARANQLAHYLRERGVGPAIRVGICVERSLEMVVGLLAIVKAGGAYVPLDPAYPPDRLAYMLTDSEPLLVMSHAATRERLEVARGQAKVEILHLDEDAVRWARGSQTNLPREELGLSAGHPAYAIYTSGSTGRPKCALNAHGALVNRLVWMQRQFGLESRDAVLQKTPFSFDVSVWEFFWPLLEGARLVMARPEGHKNPAYLSEVIAASGITVMHFVPSMLRAYLDAGETVRLDGLRHVICSGEKLTSDVVEEYYRRGSGRLTNLYGPTEAAIDVTCYECPRETRGDVPIGRPVSNTQCYVLDERYEPVPVGVAGELFLGGVQVGLGYLKRTSLTAERFVADPHSRVAGSRMYRTGDIARYRADGTIEYLGRNDAQVKVRGYRIELGEIEARLSEYPGVREAAVLAREDGTGDKRLVAYYTSAQPGSELTAEHLRTFLSVKLPEYMVPAAYVHLEVMPLSPNGKLDRKALPAPERDAFSRSNYEEPVGEIEKALSQIWCDVLKVERVGRHDNFFELGGHSLLAIRVLERMRLAGLQVDVRVLFSAPVLAELAASVKVGDVIAPPIEVVDRAAPLVPSYAQHRLWLLSQLNEVRDAYHIPFGLRLHGIVDERALRAALDELVARHESLRTTFYTQDEEVYQRVGEKQSGFALVCEDWRTQPDVEHRLRERIREEFTARFDLERGPLIRGRLIRLSEEEHVLLVTMHHIVSDGWSISIFIRELSALYEAHVRGQKDSLPPLPIQYADYAAWQRHWLSEEVLSRQGEYWKRALAGAPPLLALPTDRPRPARQDFSGAIVPMVLEGELTRQLKELSQRHGLTLFTTVLAGWALALSRLSHQKDVVIGVPSANRDRVEIEGLIGFFVNTLAIRVDLSGELTVGQLLQRVRAVMLEAQAHAQLPFEQVVKLLKPVRSLNYTPIFQAMLAWQNFEETGFHLPGLQVKGMRGVGPSSAKFDLSLSLGEYGGRIAGSLNYATSLFDEDSAQGFAECLRQALTQMVADADLLPAEERQKLRAHEEPIGEIEKALSQIWSEVLGVERIGRQDNFFALGGHSLLAVRALERMRLVGLQVDLRTLFGAPVLAELAALVTVSDTIEPPIEVVDRAAPLVSSFAQQRLWLLAHLDEGSSAYNIPFSLRLPGVVDENALRRALDRLVARHESLRTTFYAQDGEVYQRVGKAQSFPLVCEDWRTESTAGFNLERGPLIRGRLIRLSAEEHVLHVTMHHMVSDGESVAIFIRELNALYQAYRQGQRDPLQPLPIQYADYSAWQRRWLSQEFIAREGEYWQQVLAGAPSLLELPTDRPRPARQDLSGAMLPIVLEEDLTQQLKELSQRHGLTLFMTVLAAWALVLSRLSRQTDVVIGTESANRDRLELEELIGVFANTLALRVNLSGDFTVGQLLQRVREVVLDALAHAQLPFEHVVKLLEPERSLSHTPIFQVALAWQDFEGSSLEGNESSPAKFDLTLRLGERDGRIAGSLTYATALFDEGTAQRFVALLRQTLTQITADAVP